MQFSPPIQHYKVVVFVGFQNIFYMQLREALSSKQKYPQTKSTRLAILNKDISAVYSSQTVVVQIIKQSSADPLQKLLAVYFTKDCVETFNDEFISQVQHSILPLLELIAIYKAGDQDDNRGTTIFNPFPSAEEAKLGNSFLRLILECIYVWSRWFPVDPQSKKLSVFKVAYERLVKLNVKFPKLQSYFNSKFVMKHLPERGAPIKMLKECSKKINNDIEKTGGTRSGEQIAAKLNLTLKECCNKFTKKDIFYVDIWARCMRRIKKKLKEVKAKRQLSKSVGPQQKNTLSQSVSNPQIVNYYPQQSQLQRSIMQGSVNYAAAQTLRHPPMLQNSASYRMHSPMFGRRY